MNNTTTINGYEYRNKSLINIEWLDGSTTPGMIYLDGNIKIWHNHVVGHWSPRAEQEGYKWEYSTYKLCLEKGESRYIRRIMPACNKPRD